MKGAQEVLIKIYFLLVSIITLIMILVVGSGLLDTGLRAYVFPNANQPSHVKLCDADSNDLLFKSDSPTTLEIETAITECDTYNVEQMYRYEVNQAQDAVRNLSYLIVALPIFFLHFRIILREWRGRDNKKPAKK